MATILHIEDQPANRVLIERVLESQGYEVLYAEDGETGMEIASLRSQ
jgi:CheY-like chemotaxis protein